MYSEAFIVNINRLLGPAGGPAGGHEGGYVNDPNDPGGETNWGISKRSYPDLDIKNLTRAEAVAIYHRDFWDKVHADKLYPSVAYQLLDFAVNSGPETAIRYYQKALNVADDGYFGPMSEAAAMEMSETDQIMRLIGHRQIFQTKLKNWKHHGKGWAVRNAKNLFLGAEDA